ncbi:BRCT domain-containing protein [Macrophomina phaseolina MS6]|uniref:BRCT domain-containing protein n=1 Tax=Macrophomina phaseolina (strain MS6) TaxID=1126212 RepID=K2RIH0_MACPH|nr:BRCT domain-containing protein [Macrophomina phaseolina MS6]
MTFTPRDFAENRIANSYAFFLHRKYRHVDTSNRFPSLPASLESLRFPITHSIINIIRARRPDCFTADNPVSFRNFDNILQLLADQFDFWHALDETTTDQQLTTALPFELPAARDATYRTWERQISQAITDLPTGIGVAAQEEAIVEATIDILKQSTTLIAPFNLHETIARSIVRLINYYHPGFLNPEDGYCDPRYFLDCIWRNLASETDLWATLDFYRNDGEFARFLESTNPTDNDPESVVICVGSLAFAETTFRNYLFQLPRSHELEGSVSAVLPDRIALQDTGAVEFDEEEAESPQELPQDSPHGTQSHILPESPTPTRSTSPDHEMPPPKATDEEISPPSYPAKENMWHFGDDCSQGVVRRVTTQKKAAEYGELHLMKLYDTDMIVTTNNLPPENVILSSNLAYQVIRLVLQTGIIPLRHLHELWPGNFTTIGGPLVTMEPLGKSALIYQSSDNTNMTFGAYNGYVYIGSAGFQSLTGSANKSAIQMAKKARPWYDSSYKTAGLHSYNNFDILFLPEPVRKIDPERFDPSITYKPAHQKILARYKKGDYLFGPDKKSPTHPDRQSYWQEVRKITARPGPTGDTTSPEHPTDITERLSAIDIPPPDKATTEKLSDVVNIETLKRSKVCRGKNIAITGKPTYMPNQQAWKNLLQATGATIHNAVSSTTNYLITCDNSDSSGGSLVKSAKKHRILIITEKTFVERLRKNTKTTTAKTTTRLEKENPSDLDDDDGATETPTPPPRRETRSKSNNESEEFPRTGGIPAPVGYPEFVHRITFQQIAQATKILERVKQTTFVTMKAQIERQEEMLASLTKHASRVTNTLTQNHLKHDIEALRGGLESQKDILQNGFDAMTKDHATGTLNFGAAISKVTRKTFPEDRMQEALQHFAGRKDIPPTQELRAPEAWFMFPERHKHAMQRDIDQHTVIRQRFHSDKKERQPEPETPRNKKRSAPLEFHSPWETPKKAKPDEMISISDDELEAESSAASDRSLSP